MRGYAAIALPYHNPAWTNEVLPGLPAAFTDIPVDRLALVHRWIQSRSDLDASRIGISGVSKGGEFAMIAATRFSWLRAVIGIVPSDVVWEGWGTNAAEGTSSSFAWNGEALPFTPYSGMSETIAALSRGERRSLTIPHLDGRSQSPERTAAARIPVERYRGAMFVAGGDQDRTWPSGEMVRAIAERRAAAGRQTVAVSFRDAGHGLSGSGWEPMNYPGNETLVADAGARQIIWARMWEFLDASLRRVP
ncbi:MAG: dienelactone hydrolase [Sphingopyxis sp.]|nr:dienelactone hydrolase [Sphingopyxis sp.]